MARLTLRELPPRPVGSAIEVEGTYDEVQLCWPNPGDDWLARHVWAFLWFGVWLFGTLAVLTETLRVVRGRGVAAWVLALSLVAVVGGGSVVVLFVGKLLTPRQPETLILRNRELSHRRGTAPFKGSLIAWVRQWECWASTFAALRQLESTSAEREEVTGVSLEGGVGWGSVTVQVGEKRVPVGEYLNWPDREWLAEVIRLWLEKT